MTLTCVIIDDEPLAINVVKNYISQIKIFDLKATFNNAIDSLEFLQNQEIDVLFLDINMPVIDGFSFLKTLEHKPEVIITTAHEEYAAKSYELEVLDYLIKPFSFPRFMQAANKAVKRIHESKKNGQGTAERNCIFVKVDKKKMKKIFFDDILVIESLKDYIKIVTHSNNYIVHQTLGSFTETLPEKKFIRIHRSFTVSMDKIDVLEGNSLEIAGHRYTIGRSYAESVKNAILNSEP